MTQPYFSAAGPCHRMPVDARLVLAAALVCFAGALWGGVAAVAQAGAVGVQQQPQALSWAKPHAEGPIRVLIIAPRFTMSDAAAFARHVHCDLTLAPLWSSTELGGPIHHGAAIPNSDEAATLDMLRDRLGKKYDVIVAANFDFRILPDAIVASLADRVGDGAGLLLANIDPTVDPRWANSMTPLVDSDALAFITRGIGERQTPAWSEGLDFVYLASLGRGHIVWLDYPGGVPATQCLQPLSAHAGFNSDYSANYFSLIARSALWAAGIEPEIYITAADEVKAPSANPEEVPVGLVHEDVEALAAAMNLSPVTRFNIQFSKPAEDSYIVRTRTRRPGAPGDPLAISEYENPVHKGDVSFPVYVAAGTGDYFLDAWLLDDGRVVDWFTQTVHVDRFPRIESIAFERDWVNPTDSLGIDGIVELNPYQPHRYLVRGRAYDAVGRLLAESISEVTPGTNRVRLVLELEGVEGPIVRVEVAALQHDEEKPPAAWLFNVAATHREVLPVFHTRGIRSFELLANWGVADQSVASDAFPALRRLGLDGIYLPAGGTAVYDSTAAGLRPMVGARMIRDLGQSGAEQEPLFFNPRIEPLLDVVRNGAPLGAGPFLLQQSIAPAADGTENPAYESAYRNAVQRDYHNIDTLNAVWRTEFADWDSVAIPDRTDAARTGNLEPWMRYQAAVDETRSANWDIMASLMRQAFEGARVGFDFTEPFPHESVDWGTTQAVLTMPDRLTIERVRSYSKPDADRALVLPDLLLEDDSAFGAWLPWYGLIHSFTAAVWPEAVGQADRVPGALLLDAEGAPREAMPRAMTEALRIKQAGIGPLLLQAERDSTGIAIYDSRASEHLNGIEASFATQSIDALNSLIALLEGLGFQFDLVAPADALDGRLGDYRVLILPMARALSEDEVRAVRAFHRGGGCLVADVAPGQFDEHGVPRDVLPFDDLFGVQHPRPVQAAGPSETVVGLRTDGRRVTAELPGVYPDASVEALEVTVGGMADHVPTWIVNESEGACAVLLNHAIPGYRDPDGGLEKGMRVLMEALLDRWGRALPVEVDAGLGFFGETVHWRYGSADIVTLLAHPLQARETAKVRVRSDTSHRVYNRLSESARPKKGSAEAELRPGDAAVFVALPYEVRGLDLVTGESVVPGERLPFQITLDTGKATPGRHLVRIELMPPLPSPFEKRVMHVEAAAGEAAGRMRIALNARFGVYTLRATDLLTGVQTERAVQIGAPSDANQPFTINP